MMNGKIKSLLIVLSIFFIYFAFSCKTQTVDITPNNLQYAEKHLEDNMNSFIWKAQGSYLESSNISFTTVQIINSIENILLISLNFNNGKVTSHKYNYTVLPYNDAEYVELSLLPLCDYPKNYVIKRFSINLKNHKKGIIYIKINNSPLITFNKESYSDSPNINEDDNHQNEDNNIGLKPDNNENDDFRPNDSNNNDNQTDAHPEPDEDTSEENIPNDVTPSYPGINTDRKITEFQNSLFNYDYGLNDYYKQTFRYEYYPLSNKGNKYFVYEFRTEEKYFDPITNEQLYYPRILLYFRDSYKDDSKGHIVLTGSLDSAFLRSGNKESGYSYYIFNSLNGFIQKIEVEILYNSPSSYHVIVNDDKNKTNEEEVWIKLNKRR